MADAVNYDQRTPLGVCALITPWNLPLYLLTWKVWSRHDVAILSSHTFVVRTTAPPTHVEGVVSSYCRRTLVTYVRHTHHLPLSCSSEVYGVTCDLIVVTCGRQTLITRAIVASR